MKHTCLYTQKNDDEIMRFTVLGEAERAALSWWLQQAGFRNVGHPVRKGG